ncbi:MAG: hypothetical protein KIS66_13620 [Fimbriimonadaceae bacterium]|nr:hypothetical protein [Fimbriimonadaceae bacterium]
MSELKLIVGRWNEFAQNERTLRYGSVEGVERVRRKVRASDLPWTIVVGDTVSPAFRFSWDAHRWFIARAVAMEDGS